MLNQTILSLSVASANRLGKDICPKSDTVVGELVKTTLPANLSEEPVSGIDIAKLIQDVAGIQDVTETSDHASLLANAINNLTIVARDRHVRMRECIRIANDFGVRQEANIRRDDIGLYDIATFELPSIMRNADFMSMYEDIDSSGVMISWTSGMPVLNTEQLSEVVKTGTRFDGPLADFLAGLSEGVLVTVYDKYLRTQEGISDYNPSSGRGNLIIDLDVSYEYAVLFLLCNSLEMKVPENVDMPSNNYKLMLSSVKAAATWVLNHYVTKMEKAATQEILVDRFDATSKQVIVFSEVYDKFIERGGKPEVIQALPALGLTTMKSLDEILTKRETIEHLYTKDLDRLEKKRIETIKSQMISAIANKGKEIYVSLDLDAHNVKDQFEVCASRACDAIEEMSDSDVDTDIGGSLAQALVIGLWPNSKYLEYMKWVNEFSVLYPTEDIRKLEYRATIKWLVSEIVRTIK